MKNETNDKKINLKKMLEDFKPLIKYFKPKRKILISGSIMICIGSILSALIGYFCGAGLEAGVVGNYKIALICFAINALIALCSESLYIISGYIFNKAQIEIARRLGYETYKKCMNLPAYAFEEMSSGNIINIVTNDTGVIVGSLNMLIINISNLVTSIGIYIYICFNSWIIALQIGILVIIFTISSHVFTKRMKKIKEKRKKENDKFTSLANETIRGIREIKTLGIKKNLLSNLEDIIKSTYETTIEENDNSRNYSFANSLFYVLIESGTFITALLLMMKANLSPTFFVALSYYIYRFLNIFRNMLSITNTMTTLGVSFARITDIIENRKYKDVLFGDKNIDNIQGILEFKNVTFNYKNEEVILKDFNIKFEPNKKIAIVGASGGGKSTLFNLITRLFDPVSGAIYLDKINIKDLTEESLRKNISIIRQEPFLFNRSIKENFTILKKDLKLKEIREYCKMACIDEYIMSLPDKYDTILGEGGVNLSGGQKQRLAIARTLLKNSKVILFDEATSALDNESQAYIKKSIDTLAKDHTVIIVAHRLSTIIDADVIYVIRDGKCIAKGNHKKLINNCKYYKNLYKSEE